MHPDRMRRLDYWVGVPVCAILTLLATVIGWLGAHDAEVTAPENVLFIELAEMGSTVLAISAVTKLRNMHPGSAPHFLVFEHVAPSVRMLNLVPDRNVLTISPRNSWTLLRDTLAFMVDARRRRIDTTINLETFARFSTILAYLSGAAKRVGFHRFSQEGLYCGDLLTHRVAYSPHQHTWKSYVTLVDALNEPRESVPLGKRRVDDSERVLPTVPPEPAVISKLVRLLQTTAPGFDTRRLVLVNPNASKLISIRKWPLDRYAGLVRGLVSDPGISVAIIGLASEKSDAEYILREVNSDRVVDLTGTTELPELIQLFHLADLLVTNDSGPAHFASLTDVPILVFFGPETPTLYAPMSPNTTVLYSHLACSPCVSAFNQKLSPCSDNQCLKAIEVPQALRAARAILGRAPTRRYLTQAAHATGQVDVAIHAGFAPDVQRVS